MKTFVSFLTAAAWLVVVLGVGLADDAKVDPKNLVVHPHDSLIGKAVQNKAGDHLGYMEDLVIETPSGRVVYAALSTKNALGLGGKLYALPLTAFAMSADHKHLIIDVAKNEFEGKEGFDANAWPAKTDDRWAKLSKGEKASKEDKDSRQLRLTSLNGLQIKNAKGESLGKVAGFGVDCTNNRIGYAGMSYGGVAGVGTKYFAIPWKAMDLRSLNLKVQDRCFVLNATQQDFEKRQGFERNAWPVIGDPEILKLARPDGK